MPKQSTENTKQESQKSKKTKPLEELKGPSGLAKVQREATTKQGERKAGE